MKLKELWKVLHPDAFISIRWQHNPDHAYQGVKCDFHAFAIDEYMVVQMIENDPEFGINIVIAKEGEDEELSVLMEMLQEEFERLERQKAAYEADLRALAFEEVSGETIQRRECLKKALRRVQHDRERLQRVLE